MALPTSPSVVVLENDISVYAPNADSSVVGVIGFADKGPVDKATLITSPENLIRIFGRPKSDIPGQGLEGSIEILEATNQLYFVRAAGPEASQASALLGIGACPAFEVSGFTAPEEVSSIYYSVTNNAGVFQASSVVTLPTSSTDLPTAADVLKSAFDPAVTENQPVFAYVEGSKLFLASRYAGSGASLHLSSAGSTIGFLQVKSDGNASGALVGGGADLLLPSSMTTYGFTASGVNLASYSINAGAGYNLSAVGRDGSTRGISIELNNKSVQDQFVVNSDGAQVESFYVDSSPSSAQFLEFLLTSDPLNNKSAYLYANALSSTVLEADANPARNIWSSTVDFTAFPDQFGAKMTENIGTVGNAVNPGAASVDTATIRFAKFIEATKAFTGGDSGYSVPSSNTTALIGTATDKTGMYALDDDTLNISLALIPGISDDTVPMFSVILAPN